jgi:hypothetical protein
MTNGPDATSAAAGIDELNSLLRGELAAVNAWQFALRSAESRRIVEVPEILRFAAEHQRSVAALQVVVRQMGGVPESVAATEGAFALLADTGTVRDLLDGEKSGLTRYEAADGTFHGDARDLVTLELIPRQQRHVALLSDILLRLAEEADPGVTGANPAEASGPGDVPRGNRVTG